MEKVYYCIIEIKIIIMSKFRSHSWFVSPAVFLMIVILIVPVFVAGTFSFTDYNLGSPDFRWIGWKNYESLVNIEKPLRKWIKKLNY